MRVLLSLLLVAFFASNAWPQSTFTDRMPAYFVDLYGSPKKSKTEKSWSFFLEGKGNVKISGQFAVREFQKGDLRVVTVFELPSLKLVSAKLILPRKWTDEQVQAALKAYGRGWKESGTASGTQVWRTSDGAKAVNMLIHVEFQSPKIVAAVAAVVSKSDAQRQAVPAF